MNSQSCTPSKADDSSKPPNSAGLPATRRRISTTRFHSPDTSMNTVMQGTVNSMRQPKISTPSSGDSREV
ncbi:hypothetical protein D3C75_1376680 [compost metagenome]